MKYAWIIFRLVLLVTAVVCCALSIAQDGNQTLLMVGVLCSSIGISLNAAFSRRGKDGGKHG